MMKLLRSIVVALVLGFFSEMMYAWTVQNERLTYDIMFKWGLINKKAGSVALTVSDADKLEFCPRLTAASAPWADKVYFVRDTLLGIIDRRTLMPLRYERLAHEGGNYSHDLLTYQRDGNKVAANARIWRKKKKQDMITDSRIHQAEGTTLDMLSSFYFMRNLDFPSMKVGNTVHMNIFSGKKKERLTIKYNGYENVKIGKDAYPAYHITFTFTQDDGKVSSDNMDAWISTGEQRIPILLEGKLPVGKVKAVYSGSMSNL